MPHRINSRQGAVKNCSATIIPRVVDLADAHAELLHAYEHTSQDASILQKQGIYLSSFIQVFVHALRMRLQLRCTAWVRQCPLYGCNLASHEMAMQFAQCLRQ